MQKFYVTTFCNKPHRLVDGKPVAHECYILPPLALEYERRGDYQDAAELIDAWKPLKIHRGIKAPAN
jgi:hypothetical protein